MPAVMLASRHHLDSRGSRPCAAGEPSKTSRLEPCEAGSRD